MIKKVADRLEGMEPHKLIDELVNLLDNAEDMGVGCKNYLYGEGSRDEMLKTYDIWQARIDGFYEKFIK